ncbi:MAG: MarR family transcriptional regulator [Flavobacteriales bacterium]|nr:MarR family transcriptional regulator [Flavobacteriales bacterium]
MGTANLDLFFYTLDKAHRLAKRMISNELKNSGIDLTADQWVLLCGISENSNQSQANLANDIFKDTASVTRILDLLHEKDFVRRIPNHKDKRKSALKLTEAGKEALKRANALVDEVRKKSLARASENQIDTTIKTLNELIYEAT